MNINIIPHYCIQIPKILIGGGIWSLLGCLMKDSSQLFLNPQLSGHLPAQLLDSVGLAHEAWAQPICAFAEGKLCVDFSIRQIFFSSSRIFTTTSKIYSWCRWLVQLVVDRLTGPQMYICGGKSQFKEIFSFAVQIIYISQIRNNISNIKNCSWMLFTSNSIHLLSGQ